MDARRGWRPPSGGRFEASTSPFSAGWPTLYFTLGTALAYDQRPYMPCPVTRHRAPHAGRSGGASTTPTRSAEGDTYMAQTPSSPQTQQGRLRTYTLPGGWQVLV